MNRILLFCALGALWGCRTVTEPTAEAITLSCSTSESSKVGALTAGDQVAVFARVEGTEDYFLEAAQFTTGADGTTLSATPAVHYPEAKQAVDFYAYFPYHTGTFSVPTDQSTAAALKKADLCWATASTTPVSAPVPLTFQHLFARLIVQTNKPTEKIACQVVPSGVLNAATAQFSLNSSKSEVSTTGNELILPVQPLTRLVLTVSGIEYVFDGSISLLAGQTTTLNLTLHPSTKTATLSGSSTTKWIASSQSGSLEQTVSNILTLHWPNYLPKGTTPDNIMFTINGTDYTVNSGISYANQTFTVPFASAALRYPYTISKIVFPNLPACTHLLGAIIYKSNASTIGIKDIPNAIKIGNLWWATGNLVADGNNRCKIGLSGDGGLYFQFGSLIGYKGGDPANGGSGEGFAVDSLNGRFWGGATTWSWENDAMVWPSELVGTNTSWKNTTGKDVTTLSDYYFNYSVAPWATTGQDIRTFNVSIAGDSGSGTLASGRYAKQGVGDPCTYYLGYPWRLPVSGEYKAMCNNQGEYGTNVPWSSCNASWTTVPTNGGDFSGNKLFFPASGHRNATRGAFSIITRSGYGWSSSLYSATLGVYFDLNSMQVAPIGVYTRSIAFPVRCVNDAP